MGSTKINLVWQVFQLAALFLDILLLLPWFLIPETKHKINSQQMSSWSYFSQTFRKMQTASWWCIRKWDSQAIVCLLIFILCLNDCCHFCHAGGLLSHEAHRAGSFAMTSSQVLLPISTGSKWLLLAQHAEKEQLKMQRVALGVDVISASFLFVCFHFLSVSTSGVKWTVTSLLETFTTQTRIHRRN